MPLHTAATPVPPSASAVAGSIAAAIRALYAPTLMYAWWTRVEGTVQVLSNLYSEAKKREVAAARS